MVIKSNLVGDPLAGAITGVGHKISGANPPNNSDIIAGFVE
jgi:hypothetical protein